MGAQLNWIPNIEEGGSPIYERLLSAIERDIRSGALPVGARLPPHRDLAFALKLGVGTVTKAYAEAERRGLISARVGRGSFVAGAETHGAFALSAKPADGMIDMARNVPPLGPVRRRFAAAIVNLRKRAELLDAATYAPPDGLEAHRAAGTRWLKERLHMESVSTGELVLTGGGQLALSFTFATLCRPGDVVLCEAATFHGVKAQARLAGFGLRGVAMDEEGLIPDALERAAAASGARVLYTIPTLQNPTGRTMSAPRRRDIVAVARKRNLMIVEDDVYGAYVDASDRATLRDLAPERVFYISSASKAISPGLRVGFLAPPDQDAREALLRVVRAHQYAPPALPAMVFAQWIEDGQAFEIADEIVEETRARSQAAEKILGIPYLPACAHVWLRMSELEAERAAGRALRGGVEITPPAASIVDPALESGLRLCIGAPEDMDALERALRIVAAALAGEDARESAVV